MSKYRRQKRVDAISHFPKKQLSINIGHVRYSFDILKSMCHDKSIHLTQSLELEIGEEVEVVFWTRGIPELIGVSTFIKNESGQVTYSLDFSQNTVW